MTTSSTKGRWILLTIVACTMWGISSLLASTLYTYGAAYSATWLSELRQVIGGAILILLATLHGEKPFSAFKAHFWRIIAYALFGIILVQYCYFKAIEAGNASTATVLQFVGPFFIIIFLAAAKHVRPRRVELIASPLAFFGVVLLATNGHFNQLGITPAALFWGLMSAVGVATNALIPQPLLKNGVSPTTVSGWGIFLAGCFLTLGMPQVATPWVAEPKFIALVCGVILIGTVVPFQLIMAALKNLRPTTVTLLDAFEPITATIGAVLFLNLNMTVAAWVGSVLILVATTVISIPSKVANKAD